MEDQIVSALEIASDPHNPSFQQAVQYVYQLREEPSSWRPCFSIAIQTPAKPDVVRVVCLDIVKDAIQRAYVDQQALVGVKDELVAYLRRSYGPGSEEIPAFSPLIEGKIAQMATFLFASSYAEIWKSCFDDLLLLCSGTEETGKNVSGTTFYLRFLNSLHDEIGDTLLSRPRGEQERANKLKDLIRERDVQKVAHSWQEILSHWRTTNDRIAELCLKAIGKWVSWVDIAFVVNDQMLQLLFEQLERAQRTDLSDSAELARDAAVNVFTETISKKMSPTDKLQVINFLNIDNIITQLSTCPPLVEPQKSTYNVDLAETVSKLVNVTVVDIVRILEAETDNKADWKKAEGLLSTFLRHLLRYFSDEYDEVCSTVIPAMNDLLVFLQHSMGGPDSAPQRAVMLLPILKAVFAKMRYDETSDWGQDDEETDEAEFQDLRKRLGVLQQSVATTDEALYTSALCGLVGDTLTRLRSQASQINWRDLDLALYEMYLFGDLAAKGGGLYRKNKLNSPAADRLIEMMLQMIESNTGKYNHPAIQLQFMEICVRYTSFFEKQTQCIQPVLEVFLSNAHHPNTKVRLRSWYLVLRLVRQLRMHVGSAAPLVVQRLQDLLVVKAELPGEENEDEMSSDDDHTDSVFDSQMYLLEAVGCICGAPTIPSDRQVQMLQAVMQPLIVNIHQGLEQAKDTKSSLVVLQIHHDVMSLATIARGYSEWLPGSTSASTTEPSSRAKKAFAEVSEVTLLALQSLYSQLIIREAARSAFTRLIGLAGQPMLAQLPQWVDHLLRGSTQPEEMGELLRLLGQVIYGFKNAVSDFLDTLFTPLLQRVLAGISATPSGTDEELALSELKREYLGFLLTILANDTSEVMVSNVNQPFFQTVISTLEHFCKDSADYPNAKQAFLVLNRMCAEWGGPDVTVPVGIVNGSSPQTQTALPGFDRFMMQQFSPISWAMITQPSFNPKDARARSVLNEAASLQKVIYTKTGHAYLSWLRDNELKRMGMNEGMIEDYLGKLAALELKDFRNYFSQLISRSRSG